MCSMTSDGSAASRFRRVVTKNLGLIVPAAADLPRVGLADALAILAIMAEQQDPRFQRAPVRWVGRLLTETPTTLRDACCALAMVERLSECREELHRLASRR
jgi:hypothetical protein